MADLSNDYNRIEVNSSPTTKAYVWTAGDKKNPPLILIPGFTGTHVDLMSVAETLTRKYFVIVPDMPGWGESPRIPGELNVENYITYLKSLLDQLEIPKITFVGHCMGATLGIEFAKRFPENLKQLTLISTPYLGGTLANSFLIFDADLAVHFPKKIRPLFYLWRNRFFGAAANIFVIRIKNKIKKLQLIAHYILIQGEPNEDSIEETWRNLVHYDYKRIENVKVPVHILHGNEDILIPKKQVQKLHNFIPSATLFYVLNCGHMPPVENPQGLAEAILQY
jgi:pimeloyl-ACP methyl ester carboxylesterase